MKKDIELMLKSLEDDFSNEKDAFLEYSRPIYNIFVKLTPLSILKKVNKLSYKYDKELFTLELKFDKIIQNKFSWWYGLKNKYRTHVSSMFSHRIPQVLSYAKLAWYDYDWDYIYLIKALKFKLEKMESHIREGDRHLTTDYYCDQMKLVIELLSHYLNDKSSVYDELDELYPEYDREKDENALFCKKSNRTVWLDKYGKKQVTYHSGYICNEPEGYRKDFMRIYKYNEDLKCAYLRIAFHIMSPRHYSDQEIEEINNYNKNIEKKYSDNEKYSRKSSDEVWHKIEEEKIKTHSGLLNWWD